MRTTVFCLIIFSFLLSLSGISIAQEKAPNAISRIQLAAEDAWPPFSNQFGQGLSHQIIQAAFALSNIQVDSITVPYSRALMMTEKGNVDGAFNVSRQKSTEQRFVFGTTPLFVAKASFYHSNASPLTVNNKWELPKFSAVGIIHGFEYGDEFNELVSQRQLNVVEVANQQRLINLLLINRIDTAVMFDIVAQDYLSVMGVSDEISVAFPNHESQIYVAFSKHTPHALQLVEALDSGLQELQRSGDYQKIMQLGLSSKQQPLVRKPSP